MDTERNMQHKSRITVLFGGMALILAGGWWLAGRLLDIDMAGLIIMSLFALCFIAIAVWSAKNWWAIIPGGTFATIGLISVLETFVPHADYVTPQHTLEWGVFNWVMFFGLAVTFGILWLLRKTQPTNWARYPAAGLLIIALSSLFLGSRFQELWQTIILLVVGVLFLLFVLTKMRLVRD